MALVVSNMVETGIFSFTSRRYRDARLFSLEILGRGDRQPPLALELVAGPPA